MHALFFFGSLRDKGLLEIVLGRPVLDSALRPAQAEGFAALELGHEAYPYLAERAGATAVGMVALGLDADDLARLEYFEEAEYGLAPIRVETADGPVDAQYFRAAEKIDGKTLDQPWSFEDWLTQEKPIAIAAAEELMGHFGIVPVEDMDTIWPGIMIRARMRARARAEVPRTGNLRRARSADEVEQISLERPYTKYFALEDHVLRHRRFDGSWSAPMERTVLTSGDAVTVLPYDAHRDHVLLIEQFRAPIMARGDACPWGIEIVAGRLDKENDPEACARREALEEAGLTLGRMEQVAAYYPAPGFAAENITAYVGEADLPLGEGVFGCAEENEDIRAFTVSLDEALAAAASGEINNGPALICLYWLQANRHRLAQEWAGGRLKSA